MGVWEKVAMFCQETYGSFIDWDERFYVCPECEELIYKSDYNKHEDYYGVNGPCCPVCEFWY